MKFIKTSTVNAIYKCISICDSKSPTKHSKFIQIKHLSDDKILLTSILEGYIATRKLIIDDEFGAVLSSRTIYVNKKFEKILKKIGELKDDIISVEDHNGSLLIGGQKVDYICNQFEVIGPEVLSVFDRDVIISSSDINYPALDGLSSVDMAYEIKLNGKLLEKLLKTLIRQSTKRQDITLVLPKDNKRAIRVRSIENTEEGILMPMEVR